MNGAEPRHADIGNRGEIAFGSAARRPASPAIHPLDPAPTLVLFDLDDTLCDYVSARARRLRTAFATALAHAPGGGADVDLDRVIAESVAIHPHGSEHFGELLARYGLAEPAVVQAARSWYHGNRFLGLALFSDAAVTLRAIREAVPGRRIGLITNGPTEVQRDKIALLDLAPYIDFALISGEFGIAKPDPAIFHEALRRGASTVEETVFVGDSPEYDIVGARAAGIRAIWMNRSGLPWPAPSPPPVEVRSLEEVRVMLGATPAG
ncbi:MAG: hydrolase / 5-amino-6-(5-phospho-D-ribitylamino)uracil phosphatase [Thermomicrobiales bacterium]|jgi:putative hydrolase of the HAD superfamily|nr:hydrolase / 5-amino-6-(5-phospho-D-ribitylamino)uracil phosphatase [Thermomicrobiales bacterium]